MAVKAMTMEQETITPELAEQYLKKNRVNRKLRPRDVSKWAHDMEANNWRLTGDPVLFDSQGWLIDGQHRLNASIESGHSFTTWVGRNARPDVQDVKDSGARRTLADNLHMRGVGNATTLSSIIRGAETQDEDYEMKSSYYVPSFSTLIKRYDAEPERYNEAQVVATRMAQSTRMGSATSWGLAWLRLSEVDYEDAYEFFEQIRSGAEISSGDPVYALRRALSNTRNAGGSLAARRKTYALIIKAWNAWRDGVKVKTLSFKAGGRVSETMPVPH